jgi:hypothetical protein
MRVLKAAFGTLLVLAVLGGVGYIREVYPTAYLILKLVVLVLILFIIIYILLS